MGSRRMATVTAPRTRAASWWGTASDRGDAARLEAFSDGVLAIAITLLILDVRVEQEPGQSLAAALRHALPQIAAYGASFMQIGIIWVNHHALFRVVARIDQLVLLLNLMLLGSVSFLPLPTRLLAEHLGEPDARTALLLYGGTLSFSAVAYNLIWWRVRRAGLLIDGISLEFLRDVTTRYLLGLGAYLTATAVSAISPAAALVLTVLLALAFALGPSPRPAHREDALPWAAPQETGGP